MGHADAGLGHQRLDPLAHLLDGPYPIIKEINLSVPLQFPADGLPDDAVVVVHHVGLDGQAFFGRRFQQAHVPDAHHAHVQGAGNGRGGQREHVHLFLHIFNGFLVVHAEALLFIHDQQAQIMEFHVLAQQAVGAHDHVQLAFFQLFQRFLLFGGSTEAAEHIHPHLKAGKALLDGVVVLLHQNGGGRQQGHLLSLHHSLEGGPQGYFCLAVAHVAAQKAIHVVGTFHVGLDLGHGLLLILRQLVGERILKFLLPRVFMAEGIAGVLGPAGVQRRQIEGQLFQPRLDLALLALPLAAAQMVQLGQAVLRADELLHPVELVGGHVELVVSGVLNL